MQGFSWALSPSEMGNLLLSYSKNGPVSSAAPRLASGSFHGLETSNHMHLGATRNCLSENIFILSCLLGLEPDTVLGTVALGCAGSQGVASPCPEETGKLSPDCFSCLMVLGCLLGHGRSEDDCGDERSRHRDSHLLAGRLERDQEKLLR